jgi:hypothetical protein
MAKHLKNENKNNELNKKNLNLTIVVKKNKNGITTIGSTDNLHFHSFKNWSCCC